MLQSILEESFYDKKLDKNRKVRISEDVKELIRVEDTLIVDTTKESYVLFIEDYYKEMRIRILYAQGKHYGQRERHKIMMRIKKELYIKLLNYVYQTDEVEMMKIMVHFQDQLKAVIDENVESLCMRCHADCIKGELYCGQCIIEIGYVFLYKRFVREGKMSTIIFETLATPYYAEMPPSKNALRYMCKICHALKEAKLSAHPNICEACVRTKTPFIILIATLEGVVKRKDDIQ